MAKVSVILKSCMMKGGMHEICLKFIPLHSTKVKWVLMADHCSFILTAPTAAFMSNMLPLPGKINTVSGTI